MSPIIGDRVALQPAKIDGLPRTGTVEAVLANQPPRYQVRWDTGRWSIIAPTDGVLQVISPPAHGTPTRRRRRTTAAASRKD
jgi:Domain of unknown function (DUF1918)